MNKIIEGAKEALAVVKGGIESALKDRGLFAFEHTDGTFTIKDRWSEEKL